MQKTVEATNTRPPLWRDERALVVLSQVLVVTLVAGLLYFLYSNMITALRLHSDTPISFGFLSQTAGFDIKESLLEYSRASTYGRAYLVGLVNTLLVVSWGIVLATLLGILIGVMRLSRNFLVNRIAAFYIDLFRNIPLLLLLIFWSQAVFLKLPRVREAVVLPGPIFLSNRGLAMPWVTPGETWATYCWVLLTGAALSFFVALVLIQVGKRTGRPPFVSLWSCLTFVFVAFLGWITLPNSFTITQPVLEGLNITGGATLSPEFLAILSGLVIYTAAFIAEIVRAGIQSVPKGQREAATALGLNALQTLRLIVFPQALRVIIPPLTSQYLNLAKNSSLAIAVGYPDLFAIAGNTIMNQTGRAIEVFSLIMGTYLTFSLLTSLLMNLYNQRIRLVER